MPYYSTNGKFGGGKQNPQWGGKMGNGWGGYDQAPMSGRDVVRGRPRGNAGPRDFSVRDILMGELRELESQYSQMYQSYRSDPKNSELRRMLNGLKAKIREKKMEIAGLKEDRGEGGYDETYGYGRGDGSSQSQSQYQGEGGPEQESRNLSDMWKLFDQFQKRVGNANMKYGGGNVPEAWDPDTAAVPKSSVDPMAVIRSAKPRLEEEMQRMFGSAAQRLGAAGVPLSSSSYTKELGKGARKSAADLGELTMNTLFQAGENQAQRDAAAQESARDRSLSAWGQRGNWQFESGREMNANWQNMMPMFMQLLGTVSPNANWRW